MTSVHGCCRVSCLSNFCVVVVIGPNIVETRMCLIGGTPFGVYDEGMVIDGSKQSGFDHRVLRERGSWLLPMQHLYAWRLEDFEEGLRRFSVDVSHTWVILRGYNQTVPLLQIEAFFLLACERPAVLGRRTRVKTAPFNYQN